MPFIVVGSVLPYVGVQERPLQRSAQVFAVLPVYERGGAFLAERLQVEFVLSATHILHVSGT